MRFCIYAGVGFYYYYVLGEKLGFFWGEEEIMFYFWIG